MADRFYGLIDIGGRVSAAQWEEIVAAEPHDLLQDVDPLNIPTTLDDFPAVYLSGGNLRIADDEALYGHFENLEDYLRAQGIPYDRHVDAAYGEYGEEEASYRPGSHSEFIACAADGEIMSRTETIIGYLKAGLTLETIPPGEEAGIALVLLRREHPLPPFEYVPDPTTTELDPQLSNPELREASP